MQNRIYCLIASSFYIIFIGILIIFPIVYSNPKTNQVILSSKTWLKNIPDNTLISKISIPGTHNTMTYDTPVPYIQCQTMELEEQLNNGIRFFDWRLISVLNKLYSVHTYFPLLDSHFRDNVNIFYDFLISNPSEFIIIRIREEEAPLFSNNSTFSNLVQKSLTSFIDYIGTVQESRGKIILLSDFGDSNIGIQWNSNKLVIQDNFNWIDKQTKINHILDQYKCSHVLCQGTDKLYINFLSASSKYMTPYRESTIINTIIYNMTTSMNIIVMNFPAKDDIDYIISQNEFFNTAVKLR